MASIFSKNINAVIAHQRFLRFALPIKYEAKKNNVCCFGVIENLLNFYLVWRVIYKLWIHIVRLISGKKIYNIMAKKFRRNNLTKSLTFIIP